MVPSKKQTRSEPVPEPAPRPSRGQRILLAMAAALLTAWIVALVVLATLEK